MPRKDTTQQLIVGDVRRPDVHGDAVGRATDGSSRRKFPGRSRRNGRPCCRSFRRATAVALVFIVLTLWSWLNEYDLGRDPKNRDRFWNLLKQKGVVAFFCGHHHQFKVHRMNENDVWQVLSAWGRGCDPPNASDRWKHVKCTFVKVTVNGGTVTYEAYRGPRYGGPCGVPYSIEDRGTLVAGEP